MSLILVLLENERDGTEFELTENVTLIGRRANGIMISDPSVSGRHASLERDGESVIVKDLKSKNGTYINDKKIEEGRLMPGDTLRVGKVKLILEEVDRTVTEVGTVEIPQEPKRPAPPQPSVALGAGGECSTTLFDDASFSPVGEQTKTLEWDSATRDYIDFSDDDGELVKESEDMVEQRPEGDSLEITTFVSGNIFFKDYFPLKNGFFYTGKGRPGEHIVDLPGFYDEKPRPVIEIEGETPWLLKLDNFKCRSLTRDLSEEGERWKLEKGDTLSLESGVTQLMVRYGKIPPELKRASLLRFDQKDIKRFALSSGVVLVLVLLALLFDTRIEEVEKKTVSVVYRPKPILMVKPKPKPRPTPIVKASKESAKKSGKKSPIAKTQKTVAKKKPKREVTKAKPKKVIKSVAKPTPRKKPAVQKSYSFSKSNKSQLKNLFKSISDSGTPKVVKDTGSPTAKTLTSVREVSGEKGGISSSAAKSLGKIGGGPAGKYDFSTGSRGLSSKKGVSKVGYSIEAAVVSGGIDAELLSKILRELIPQFQHCYQRELVRNKNLEGVVDLYFRITPAGKATDVRVKGKQFSFSPGGEVCMKKVFNLVQLPRPPGGGVVDVKQALNFSSLRGK